MEEGVIYPGETKVAIALEVENNTCSNLTSDNTSCTAFITEEGQYNITLSLSNNVGQAKPVTSSFNCE